MYFLVTLGCTIVSAILWYINRERKNLHLDILTITFGSSALMWLIDCIFSAAEGEGFLSFEQLDGWIALAAFAGAIILWLIISFVLNNNQKVKA